jgi:hypothetical protein
VKLDDDEYEVVDGQQRLTAIYEFVANELSLSEDTSKEFGGPQYKDLRQRVSDSFDDFEIEYDEIEDASEEELKQFFLRLQQGLPLTSSEKLDAIHSKLRDFCANFLPALSRSLTRATPISTLEAKWPLLRWTVLMLAYDSTILRKPSKARGPFLLLPR